MYVDVYTESHMQKSLQHKSGFLDYNGTFDKGPSEKRELPFYTNRVQTNLYCTT